MTKKKDPPIFNSFHLQLPKILSHTKDTLLQSFYLGVIFTVASVVLFSLPRFIKSTEQKLVDTSSFGINEAKAVSNTEKREMRIEITNQNILPPSFNASAVLAIDYDSGQILFQKNIHTRLSPASTTKIMTALVSSEYFQPASILVVPNEALVGGANMGLQVGENLSYRSLLYGMMLNSGNDAAFTIAGNFEGGIEGFVAAMNDRVAKMGLKDTSFANPAGFDDPKHYSSAFDLAQIAKEATLNSQLSRVVSTKETLVAAWDKTKSHNLKNLNELLSEEGVLGIKTGFTEKAGESFVGLIEREGKKVITVVLNSEDRFGETKRLMDWIYQNYDWKETY